MLDVWGLASLEIPHRIHWEIEHVMAGRAALGHLLVCSHALTLHVLRDSGIRHTPTHTTVLVHQSVSESAPHPTPPHCTPPLLWLGMWLLVVGHWFHIQNWLSESKIDSIIEVTSVLAVKETQGARISLSSSFQIFIQHDCFSNFVRKRVLRRREIIFIIIERYVYACGACSCAWDLLQYLNYKWWQNHALSSWIHDLWMEMSVVSE